MGSQKRRKGARKRNKRKEVNQPPGSDVSTQINSKVAETTCNEPEANEPFPASKYTDLSFSDNFKKFEVKRDFLEYFARDSESSIPSWDAELIKQYCRPTIGNQKTALASNSVKFQLHDREFATNDSRSHPEVLTLDQLRQALTLKRFKCGDLPDASRRQILISNMDAESICVLAETATVSQVPTLRDAISKHISGETSFKVQKQVDGPDTTRLEMHLPYLALRRVSADEHASVCSDNHDDNITSTFIVPGIDAPGKAQTGPYVIYKAKISIVLWIWDHTNWIAYAFTKSCPPANFEATVKESSDDSQKRTEVEDGEDEEEEEAEEKPLDDIFSPDNGMLNLSRECAIWNPRKYYLRIMAIWIDVVKDEYKYLVQTLDLRVKDWVSKPTSLRFHGANGHTSALTP
jgi:hypothetical protein